MNKSTKYYHQHKAEINAKKRAHRALPLSEKIRLIQQKYEHSQIKKLEEGNRCGICSKQDLDVINFKGVFRCPECLEISKNSICTICGNFHMYCRKIDSSIFCPRCLYKLGDKNDKIRTS